jgi:hypothetical protein
MFVFVSEPTPDLDGDGASFAVGVIVVRCASMSNAISLSQRLRALLQSLARRSRSRGVRHGPRSGLSNEVEAWIDEIIQQGLALEAQLPATSAPSLPHRNCDELDALNRSTDRISDTGN